MTTFNASTTAELVTFAGLAQNGDTILLAPGTYSGVTLQNIVNSGNVTITSANPGNPAVLNDLMIKNSQGLTFSNLEFNVKYNMPFQVLVSSRINFDGLDVHGTLNGSSSDDFQAMLVRYSNNVSVTNSHFHELTDALAHNNSSYLNFSGNLFDLIRDNGISGGGSSFVTIANNVFKDFDHVGGIHPDAIQFWTAQTNASATDITITGNVISRGSGVPIQGIFISDQVGNLPYQHVTISNNVAVGAMYNGITLSNATDAIFTNNVVLGQTDQQSWLGIWNVAAGTWSGNIASSYTTTNSTITAAGDIQTSALTMAQAALLSAQLDALAIPGQLAGVAANYAAMALAQVYWLDYLDGAPASGASVVFDVVPINGTSGVDTLRAPAVGQYHLTGFAGNDSLIGGTSGHGSNILEGGLGDDVYTIYSTGDVILENPGEGWDSVYAYADYTIGANVDTVRAMNAGITVHGNAGNNTITGSTGGNTLYGEAGNDLVQGSGGVDVLFGNDGDDRLLGNDGNDTLDGGNGNDALYGGNGNDTMFGGAGNDTIEGDAGIDILTGGTGTDTFVYRVSDFAAGLSASKDIIKDFHASEGDRISLVQLDAKTGTSTNDTFSFIGTQAFHGVAGELRYVLSGDGIDILGDTNGDKVANLSIHLTGITSITSSSFIL